MELKKLIEGLPIKIISGEKVEVDPYVYHRKQVVFNLDSEEVATILGWRVILALMDEAQEEVSVSKDSAEFAKKSRGIPLNISGGEVDEAEQNHSGCEAKLQSARELAEMVQRNDWTPWAKKELEAKAREVLEKVK